VGFYTTQQFLLSLLMDGFMEDFQLIVTCKVREKREILSQQKLLMSLNNLIKNNSFNDEDS